jgi:polyisoprenoid-binding protein YceI
MTLSSTGTVYLYCFKAGLLSRVAHDIRLRVQPREFTQNDSEFRATFSPMDIEVDGAMRGTALDPLGLSQKDKHEIRKKLRSEVLKVQSFPEIRVSGHLVDRVFEGQLTLKSTTRPLKFPTTLRGHVIYAEFEIRPSHWGIPPYKALLGAIQLQDRILVECRFPMA